MSTYSELLRDERWNVVRKRILERDNHTCQHCDRSDTSLSVHHLVYYHGKMPWEARDRDLIALCSECHNKAHEHRAGYTMVRGRRGMHKVTHVSNRKKRCHKPKIWVDGKGLIDRPTKAF